jgi:CHAT domain
MLNGEPPASVPGVKLAGIAASAHQNEQVAPSPLATDYYVAHLFLLPDQPGPNEVTPFCFASVDLCELSPYMQLLLDTQPSLHGYTRHLHRYNYIASHLHRFSYFLISCYARNFNREYAEQFGRYLAKIVYVHPRVPLDVLEKLRSCEVPPLVVGGTKECVSRARELGLPSWGIDEVTPDHLNAEIARQFRTPSEPLTPEQLAAMAEGRFEEHIPPNAFVATYPAESEFNQSPLLPYQTSGLRLLLPNEALSNRLRRCYMPAPARERPDPAGRLAQAVSLMQTIFAQSLADHLLEDPKEGPADPTLAPGLRQRLDDYKRTQSPDAYESLVSEARRHLGSYAGACGHILCCPAINKKGTERIFKRTVPGRVLKAVYAAKAEDFLTYVSPRDFRSEEQFQSFKALMTYQSLENAYLSTVLALYAVSYRKPVLRVPHLGSGLFGRLRHLRATYSAGNRQAFARDLQKFCHMLLNSLPRQVQDFMRSTPSGDLKLISDLPMEWLALDGVPLMFLRSLSRLPLTPGNGLFAHFNACREDLHMGPREAKRILITNCLRPDDPLYPFPRAFAEVTAGMGVPGSYAEPANLTEYAAALRAHSPYILVHWGHGSYDRDLDRGYLHIRDERTEVWDLREAAVPPIVLLAACETAAIAETHNTPANGWLALGARSVLASYFPVEADLTTALFSRIFANLLEAVHGRQQLGSWAAVVSHTLSLNRYLDFFYGFNEWRRSRRLPPTPGEVILEYTYLWNRLRCPPAEAYQRCPQLLIMAMERFGSELAASFREYVSSGITLPHTMFFSHLGAPETIILGKERQPSFDEDSPAQMYWQMRSREDAGSHVGPPGLSSQCIPVA